MELSRLSEGRPEGERRGLRLGKVYRSDYLGCNRDEFLEVLKRDILKFRGT